MAKDWNELRKRVVNLRLPVLIAVWRFKNPEIERNYTDRSIRKYAEKELKKWAKATHEVDIEDRLEEYTMFSELFKEQGDKLEPNAKMFCGEIEHVLPDILDDITRQLAVAYERIQKKLLKQVTEGGQQEDAEPPERFRTDRYPCKKLFNFYDEAKTCKRLGETQITPFAEASANDLQAMLRELVKYVATGDEDLIPEEVEIATKALRALLIYEDEEVVEVKEAVGGKKNQERWCKTIKQKVWRWGVRKGFFTEYDQDFE